MTTRMRRYVATAVAALAVTGFTTLTAGSADATTTAPAADGMTSGGVCRYYVNAKGGLNVRNTPGGKVIGALPYKTHLSARCTEPSKTWARLRAGVPKKFIDKYVFREYLTRIHSPKGGVDAGGGGTAVTRVAASPGAPLAAAGLGAIALGGGLGIVSWRRREREQP